MRRSTADPCCQPRPLVAAPRMLAQPAGHRAVRRAASQSDDRHSRHRQEDRRLRAEQSQGGRDAIQVRPDRRRRRAALARQSRFLHGRRAGSAAAQFAPDRERAARRRSRWSAAPIPATPAWCSATSCSRSRSTRFSSSRCALRFRRCRRCTSRSSAAICAPRRSSSSMPSPGVSWHGGRQHAAGPADRADRRIPALRADHDARDRQQGRPPVHAGGARRHGAEPAARDLPELAARLHQARSRRSPSASCARSSTPTRPTPRRPPR